jgi:hypothetical protein
MKEQQGQPVLSLSDRREYDYGLKQAFKAAAAEVGRISDIEEQCRRAGADLQPDGRQAGLSFLGRSCMVSFRPVDISYLDSPDGPSLREKVLVLHYLVSARGTPPADRYIAFKDLPEGAVYFPSFYARAIRPWLTRFGRSPGELISAAAVLGGERLEGEGTRVVIPAFEHVSVTLVLWEGDDEFPPEGGVLFDASVADLLSTEDITVLCETIAWRLVRGAPEGGDRGH